MEKYERIQIEVIVFEAEDIIATNDGDIPLDPVGLG